MRVRLGIAGALAAVCASVVLAPSAHAADPIYGGVQTIVNEQTGRCLDSDVKGYVYTKACTDNNRYQQWHLETEGGDLHIRNVQTGFCLTAVNGEEVRAIPCAGSYRPMSWEVIKWRGNNIRSRPLVTNLDSDHKGNVYLKSGSLDNRYQSWLFYPAG
ncbi:RICIN domain-containing protein [Streptomyces sp. NPDC059788]|uniref:RICIN domain-containing protein n=1 Tax=Streptomyces sp. NPDC059788 TaxID=3346948 RepID=UPI003661AFE4